MSDSIYTRDGDTGETSLVGGTRVPKHSARVEAYGTVDEANAAIGLVRTRLSRKLELEADFDVVLEFVQHKLFNCSSRLATPDEAVSETTPEVTPANVTKLESAIDRYMAEAGEFKGFVLPGGCELGARLHVARTVTRRAERQILAFADEEPVDADLIAFVNRLSDLLFAMARVANEAYLGGDTYWDPAL